MLKKLFLLVLIALSSACSSSAIIDKIPLNATPPVLAKPIFMAIDNARARAYLLNSNYTVNYADASFMVLDLTNPIAPKVIKAVSIPNFS
ncbi:MAG: hypothetical protein JNK65_10180, partial [Deltaproteobacteria bacterium]|nr:hypothetical protein [Deltaproteobacteria bacterium]